MSEPVWWWLSFVDRTDADDTSVACHLGIAIVKAGDDIVNAIDEAWAQHCNPGGEVKGAPTPEMPVGFRERFTNRLLTDPAEIAEAQIAIDQFQAER